MKTLRSVTPFVVGAFLFLSVSIISPVRIAHNSFAPPLQSETILTATGQFCDDDICVPMAFSFNPAGGTVIGSFEGVADGGSEGTAQISGTLEGEFSGGDGGVVNGTFFGENVMASGRETFQGTWEGVLWGNGTGSGVLLDDWLASLYGDEYKGYPWTVTFDAQAFQAGPSGGVGVPTSVEVVGMEIQLDPSARDFIAATLPLSDASEAILNQDSVIIARDNGNNFYAVSNHGEAIQLPVELRNVFQAGNNFAVLGSETFLASSEFSTIRGTINGGGDFVFLDKIPGDLKSRDYALLTTTCSQTFCTPELKINSTASSTYILGEAMNGDSGNRCKPSTSQSGIYTTSHKLSSEHSTIRGTINGGG